VRDEVEQLIPALRELACPYLEAGQAERADLYYRVRASEPVDRVSRAARLLFLNRTCYNGLYRVNRGGRFNVPHGRYAKPAILNEQNLRDASSALRGVDLSCLDFEEACRMTEQGDFVYLDPPYHPLSRTSQFTAYTSADFGWPEQERLARTFRELTARGVYALVSNSAHDAIRDLYQGFEQREVSMSRSINSHPGRRQPIAELLVSNIALVDSRRP
jgi:DNA adenine methylase